jgi:hypothetical protein
MLLTPAIIERNYWHTKEQAMDDRFKIALSKDLDITFNPDNKEATFHFESWSGPRQLALNADEVLRLVELIKLNGDAITQTIETNGQ